ncbi:MAG TPA: 2-dehydro-3-deoxygalactonokinase [Candidatus Merdisoma merdipullorum]|nr:2-dehydro-3-deoxygalactonokinase [Candidatus Merdisoma merdipullorum]
MQRKYSIYYDSGTSNSRIYVLDSREEVVYRKKAAVGSKDSAIAGSNRVLIEGLKGLYDAALEELGLQEEDIGEIYASGMVTSPYGLKEVPHMILPVTAKTFADHIVRFYEGTCFQRELCLIPGLKTADQDISGVNNMRGEEMEILGTLDSVGKMCGDQDAALIFPGSHTHVTCVNGNDIKGIVSNFTGELFHALKTGTILSPVLDVNVGESGLNPAEVKRGVENLKKMGFNRAIYICHAMRLFQYGTPEDRFSYAEGVINGGVRESLEYYCREFWHDCHTAVVVSEEFMFRLFQIIFEDSKLIRQVLWLPISPQKSYAVEGLKKILACRKEM